MKYSNNSFVELCKIPDLKTEIWKLEIDKYNNLWACTRYKGVYKINLNKFYKNINDTANYIFDTQIYDTSLGLPINKDIMVYNNSDSMIFCTAKGIYKFDYEKNFFYYDSITNSSYPFTDIYHFKADYNNENLWIATFDNPNLSIGYNNLKNPSPDWNTENFLRIKNYLLYDLEFSDDNKVWLATSAGIYIYNIDFETYKKTDFPFNCLISKIIIGTDSTIFDGRIISNKVASKIEYILQSLYFLTLCLSAFMF